MLDEKLKHGYLKLCNTISSFKTIKNVQKYLSEEDWQSLLKIAYLIYYYDWDMYLENGVYQCNLTIYDHHGYDVKINLTDFSISSENNALREIIKENAGV